MKKLTMKSRKWKEFKIEDIFTIKKGKRLTKKNQKTGRIPFIGATEKNNGITSFISKPNDWKTYKNFIGVNYDGSVGFSFYHKKESIVSDSVLVLQNTKLSKRIALFFCTTIETLKEKYSYGRKLNSLRLEKEKIWLPIDDKDKIDYKFMEDYMKQLETEIIPEIPEFQQETTHEVTEVEWREFIIDDIFDTETCKSLDKGNITKGTDINYVTRKGDNNGVFCKVNSPDKKYIYKGKCLTMAFIGCPGITFYQDKDFCASQNIGRLVLKKDNDKILNKYIGLFLSTSLEELKRKYSYGRPLGTARLKKEKIWLPIDNKGKPNYEWMELYMKSFSFSNLLNKK